MSKIVMYKCPYCELIFIDINMLIKHFVLDHLNIEFLRCPICKDDFEDPISLIKHVTSVMCDEEDLLHALFFKFMHRVFFNTLIEVCNDIIIEKSKKVFVGVERWLEQQK